MSVRIDVVFNKKEEEFQPGDEVGGTVTLDVEADINIRGVLVRCVGKCHNSWVEWGHRTYYRKNEKYIDSQVCLWPKGGKVGQGVVLRIGQYQFPFEFLVPQNTPPSFEGGVGSIRYHIEVCIDRVLNPTNFTFKKQFTVIRRGELIDDQLTTDGFAERSPTLIGSHSPVKVSVSCDKPSYDSGDVIHVDVAIKDSCEFEVEKIRLALRQTCVFEGKSLFTFCKRTHDNVSEISENVNAKNNIIQTLRPPDIQLFALMGHRRYGNDLLARQDLCTTRYCLSSEWMLHYSSLLQVELKCGREIKVKVPLQINCISKGKAQMLTDDLPSYSALAQQDQTNQLESTD